MDWEQPDELEIDPYAAIRPALSPQHANLEADKLTKVLGPTPATLVLHQLLNSPELRYAAVSTLLGNAGRNSVNVNGADVPVAAYLRMVSRLCREVAEQSETVTPNEEQQLPPSGGADALTDSVGRKGRNLPDDVKRIQELLNLNLPLPSPPLSHTGIMDATTIDAIEQYQLSIGLKTPDGLVARGGATFKSLAADKFCFLPHRVQPSVHGSIDLDAAQMNPGFLTPTGVTRDPGLQDILKRRILDKRADLRALRFALVDLTGLAKLASPQFAGHRDTEQGGLGSMSKLACLYGCFQLKFDLEELSRQRGITNQKDLFDAARHLWRGAQKPDLGHGQQLFADKPKIELLGKLIAVDGKPLIAPLGFSLPELESIFEKSPVSTPPGLTLVLKGSDKILVDPSVHGSPLPETPAVREYIRRDGEDLREVRKLAFAERLFLMIDESDNAAAHSCIEKVGFFYIHSAIWQSGFYSPARGGGLWEASTHDVHKVRWVLPPVPKGDPNSDFVSANASSIAAMLTLIEQKRLVNADACAAMKYLTDKRKAGVPRGSHTRSYFLEGLQKLFTMDEFHSKLGIGSHLNDAAIVVRTVKPDPADSTKDRQIRYAAAGFDDPSPLNGRGFQLEKLIVELDKCIRENNGLLSPTAP
jgi:hypothetical protein